MVHTGRQGGGGALRELVEAATKAPSSHNTQPWLFELGSDEISLIADRTRALPANDPQDRELTISCGAALFNLRVAVAASGRSAQVELLPAGSSSDVLARVRISANGAGAGTAAASMAPAIDARRTSRRPFEGRQIPAELVSRLEAGVEAEGAWLVVVDDPTKREAVAELVAEGDRTQFADAAWRRELASWMHSRRSGDGLAVPGFARPFTKLAVSAVNLGRSTGDKDVALAEETPILMIVGTETDDPEEWLRAGQALEHALLLAAGEGVHAGYLNQPCQLPELRKRLRELLGRGGFPQVVVRLGYAVEELERAPRRRLDDVLIAIDEDRRIAAPETTRPRRKSWM